MNRRDLLCLRIQELADIYVRFLRGLMRKPVEWQYVVSLINCCLSLLQKAKDIFSQVISSLWKKRNNRIWFQSNDDVIAKSDGTGRKRLRPRPKDIWKAAMWLQLPFIFGSLRFVPFALCTIPAFLERERDSDQIRAHKLKGSKYQALYLTNFFN